MRKAFVRRLMIGLLLPLSLSAQNGWIWSVQTFRIVSGIPDTLYADFYLQTDESGGNGHLGHFNLQGIFPANLYGFESNHPPMIQSMHENYAMTVTSDGNSERWQVNAVLGEDAAGVEVNGEASLIFSIKFMIQSVEDSVQLEFVNLQETWNALNLSRRQAVFRKPDPICLNHTQQLVFQPDRVELITFNLSVPDSVIQHFLDKNVLWMQTEDRTVNEAFPYAHADSLTAPQAFRMLTRSENPDTAIINGYQQTLPAKPCSLTHQRMNWIGSPYRQPVSVEAFFAAVTDWLLFARNDDGLVWVPDMGINTLSYVEPGEGIELAMKSSMVFSVPEAASLGQTKGTRFSVDQSVHFNAMQTGLPSTYILQWDADFLASGDELGLFDGDLCAGCGIVPDSTQMIITAWEGLPQYGISGFQPGNAIRIKWWNGHKEEVLGVQNAVENEVPPAFQNADFKILLLHRVDTGVSHAEFPGQFSIEAVYPNPFNPMTRCVYYLPVRSDVRLAVYDIRGREVRLLLNQEQKSGRHTVVWDGMDHTGTQAASGMYIIAMDAGSFQGRRKVMLMR